MATIGRSHASEVGGEGVALDQVTGIEDDDLPGILRPQGIHHGGDADQAAGEGLVGGVVPGSGAAVDVGGGNDDEVGGCGLSGQGGQECGEPHAPEYTRPC